jgi:hypothetical protein
VSGKKRIGLACGAASLLLVACNALLALEPLRYDDEGATDAAAKDDGKPVGDALPGDAVADGDAGSLADATFCSSDAHDFCDDFEGTRTIQGPWSGYGAFGPTTGFIEAGVLVVDMRPADAAAMEVPRVGLTLDKPWSPGDGGGRRSIDVRFRALVEECPHVGDPQVTITGLGVGGRSVDLVIGVQGPDCVASIREIVLAGPTYRASGTLLVPVGKWEDYGFSLPENAAGTGGEAMITVGVQTTSLTLTAASEPVSFYAIVGVAQGEYRGGNARARFDDVRIDYLK